MTKKNVKISKTWRSEIQRFMVFFILCIASVVASSYLPGSIIRGELFSIGSQTVFLSLPLFWLLPLGSLLDLLLRIYDVLYTVDASGIQARIGILSLRQRVIRVRFEDIRTVETEQTLLERFLDVGNVEIATAATDSVEITLEGVAAPHEIRLMIQAERDRRVAVQSLQNPKQNAANIGD
ncbi:MAG: PH domain-containing protein [Bdellovibrionales bacterium]|nr:PH domain-containing protein [Bdellovibrionales bacterium]